MKRECEQGLIIHRVDRNARLVQTLELVREGLPIDEIARRLPNHRHPGGRELGVGANVARRIVKDSLRFLAAHAERNLRPHWLPDHLWPPPSVRRELEQSATDRRLDHHLKPLESWLRQGGGPSASLQEPPAAAD